MSVAEGSACQAKKGAYNATNKIVIGGTLVVTLAVPSARGFLR